MRGKKKVFMDVVSAMLDEEHQAEILKRQREWSKKKFGSRGLMIKSRADIYDE